MEQIEDRVKSLRKEIVRCIQEPSVLVKLGRILNYDDVTRISSMYQKCTAMEATGAMVDTLLASTAPGKWQAFLEALEDDFKFLRWMIENEDNCSDDRPRQMIKIFMPDLQTLIDIDDDPTLLVELLANDVISDVDKETIMATTRNHGNYQGVMCMLGRITCHLKPDAWYYQFLCALDKTGHRHVVKKLEPDFLSAPSRYLPKMGPINPGETDHKSTCGTTAVDTDSRKAGEAVMYEYQDASLSGNLQATKEMSRPSVNQEMPSVNENNSKSDLDDNPKITVNTSATDQRGACTLHVATEQSYAENEMQSSCKNTMNDLSPDENTSNLKELNIKPEVVKDCCVESQYDEDSCSDINSMASSADDSDDDEEESSVQLRSYQLELAEYALQGHNTIVCSETGTGKTWVALHIMEKHLLERYFIGIVPRKVAFMARTNILITQQADRIRKYLLQYKVKLLRGEDEENRMMAAFMRNHDILCFTPQVLVNNLDQGTVKLSDYSLLLFDECHHAKGYNPYTHLLRRYLLEKERRTANLPQIVGFTASIGVGKSKTPENSLDYILRVCALLDTIHLSTVERNRQELEKYITVPTESAMAMVIRYPDPARDAIMNAMEEVNDMMEALVVMQPDMIELNDKQPSNRESPAYYKWTLDMLNLAMLKVVDTRTMRDVIACCRYLNVYNTALEMNKLLQIKDVVKFMADRHGAEIEQEEKLTRKEKQLYRQLETIQVELSKKSRDTSSENPNVKMVRDQLRRMIGEKGPDSRAIVFVKARATCRAMAVILDRDLKKSGYRVHELLGKGERIGDVGMTEDEQTDVLEKFRDGSYMVLVCTSVGTEGIDVPDCNIVINYNYIGNEINKIQMKGRTRKHGGRHVLISDERHVQRETINVFKVDLMYKAIEELKKMHPRDIKGKVREYQREEAHKYKYRLESDKLKKSQVFTDDFMLLCRRCSALVCLLSDVRRIGNDRFVIDPDFPSRITLKPHKKPIKYDGKTKRAKMYCKGCPLAWGIVVEIRGVEVKVLKIGNLKFKDIKTKEVSVYDNWFKAPYNAPEMTADEVAGLRETQ